MTSDERQALAAAYALGALEPAEARACEAQLAQDPELAALVSQYQEVSALLADGAPDVPPPAGLRERVMMAAREPRAGASVVPIHRRRDWTPLAWAAALAGLLAAGVQTVRLARMTERSSHLATDLRAAAARRDLLEERQAAILDGNTRMYVMQPTSPAPGTAYGAQVFWRRDQGTWLVHAYALPRLASGQVYQLWYVTADAKISAGVFEVDDEGHGIAVLKVPAPAQAAVVAAMSVEPAGGSEQPTGPIVLAGSVTGT